MFLNITIIITIIISLLILVNIQRKDKLSFPLFLLTSLALALISGLIIFVIASFIKPDSQELIKWLPTFLKNSIIIQALSFLGNIFTTLMKMLIGPLIFSAIFRVITQKYSNSKKIFLYAIVSFILMVTLSSILTIGISLVAKLGNGIDLTSISQANPDLTEKITSIKEQASSYNFFELLSSFLPSNIFNDLANNNMIAIIIFTFIFGICTNIAKKDYAKEIKVVENFIDAIFRIFSVMIDILLGILPYSIFAMILNTILAADFSSFKILYSYISVILVTIIITFILQLFSLMIFKINPLKYLKTSFPALVSAFSTASSNATLPIAITSLKENKVRDDVANVIPTLGTTMGMAGCGAIYPTIITVLTYVSINGNLPINVMIQIVLVVILASFGMQGVPGTAMYAAILTLTTLNLPLTAIILVAPIDFFVDMFRTTLNVNGSMVIANITNKFAK